MQAFADHNDSDLPIRTGDVAALDEIAAFPEQNPNPVFRVGADGSLLYANPASGPLLAGWGVTARGEFLPEPWRARVADALAAGAPAKWDTTRADHVLQLNFVPIVAKGYVNVYGADVTELRRALALSQRLVAMQEAERSYVADQLYNQAGQVLAAAQMQLARLGRGDVGEQLPLINATLNEAISELHALATQLRPYTLDRSTLASALRSYLAEFSRLQRLAVRFDAGNAESARPPADVATSLFRSLQEGLTNVARHAFATAITVTLRVEGETLFVTLADDGVGFDPQAAALAGGLGLASIRERLKTVGGQLKVESGPDGSALVLSAPLGEPEQAR